MTDGPWTVRDGAQAVLRFLLRRAPAAALVWMVLGAATVAWANTGAVAGGFSAFGMLIALVATLAGYAVGLVVARGLLDAVHFTGWIPTLMACAAAAVVVLSGWFVLRAILGMQDAHLGAIIAVTASVGALGAVARSTWAET